MHYPDVTIVPIKNPPMETRQGNFYVPTFAPIAPIAMSLRRSTTALFRRASALLDSQATISTQTTGGVFSLGARRSFASDADLHKTALYDFHVKNGGTCCRQW